VQSSEEFPPMLEVVAQSISSSMLGIVMMMERSGFSFRASNSSEWPRGDGFVQEVETRLGVDEGKRAVYWSKSGNLCGHLRLRPEMRLFCSQRGSDVCRRLIKGETGSE
jgi:hypothetical protein